MESLEIFTTWKTTIPVGDGPIITTVPKGSVLLKARADPANDTEDKSAPRKIIIWFRCLFTEELDADSTMPWSFRIFGTGHGIKKSELTTHQYVDSIFDGPFVWHLYQERF
jgi:hypothetical protein